MTTSPTASTPAPGASSTSGSGQPLRLALHPDATGHLHGAWWPRSRALEVEAADLVDQFPAEVGRIDRLLFSRPDWDAASPGGRTAHRIHARRGPVKVGSFPSDDTHLMVLSMSTGQRLRLVVVPSDLEAAEGERRMQVVAERGPVDATAAALDRWDEESPGS